jgi:predicted  nucleic acid-binding Zn-ribbon protein
MEKFNNIRGTLDGIEYDYNKLSDEITRLKNELADRDQTIAELEEQINETPTEPAYAG